MTFPVPNLDDRTFQDIVDEAKRLIPAFCPEWTAPDVADPGVAILELFAWMSEMIIYRLNQVPDVFYTRMLNLMGVEPYPQAVARAEMMFWWAASFDQPVRVPRGTEVATHGEDAVVFATLEDLEIAPTELISLVTASASGNFVVRYENGFPCFDPLEVGASLYLGFSRSQAHAMVRVDVDATLLVLGVDPHLQPLVWECSTEDGWMSVAVINDTTAGLCRSGSLTLLVGEEHEALTLSADQRAHWIRARLVEGTQYAPQYPASPVIESVTTTAVGGSVVAEHSETMPGKLIGISDGRPDQRFAVGLSPVLPRFAGETLRTLQQGVLDEWTEVDSFIDSGPLDRHFMWSSATGEIRFGPQIRDPHGSMRNHGAIPPPGAEVEVTGYRIGGGATGNVGAGTLSILRGRIAGVERAQNLHAASGGVDPESLENAKARLPQVLRRGNQLVTSSDFERACVEADPSVARVRCLPPIESGGPVRLLVVPYVDVDPGELSLDDLALSAGMYDQLSSHLDERRVLGTEVEISTPYYQGVSVVALLSVQPGRPSMVVRERVLQELYRFLDPIVGGWSGAGWPFESDLRAATLYPLLEGVEGVESVDEILLFDVDLRNHTRVGMSATSVRLADTSLFVPMFHRVEVR